MLSFCRCSKLIGKSYNLIPQTLMNNIPSNYAYNEIIKNKHNEHYDDDKYELYMANNNQYMEGKKLISVSPGGFKGFYQFGVLSFIKKNYNLDNYIFTGASAGAWNCLFMSYKKDMTYLKKIIFNDRIIQSQSLSELQYNLKYIVLTNLNESDFDLEKLFLGVTTFRRFEMKTNIYTDFDDLEDAIDCCIASSHIPFITGSMVNKYHNKYSFDGGFSSYPYLNVTRSILHITPNMWDDMNYKKNDFRINRKMAIKDIIYRRKFNLLELYYKGYDDTKKQKEYLDKIFLNNE